MISSNKSIIVEEAGVNHNGDISLAMELVRVAAVADVVYINFKLKASKLASKLAKM